MTTQTSEVRVPTGWHFSATFFSFFLSSLIIHMADISAYRAQRVNHVSDVMHVESAQNGVGFKLKRVNSFSKSPRAKEAMLCQTKEYIRNYGDIEGRFE